MKKVGEIMNDLGFNINASDDAKKAFIKYLINTSFGANVKTIDSNPESKIKPTTDQLSFDFEPTLSYRKAM